MVPVDEQVETAIAWLKRHATSKTRDGMARYAIPSEHAFGVSMAHIQQLAKQLGRSHALADALWDTGWYEARMLAAYVDEPARVTSSQMDRWCRDFDNWAICDTLCFALFDRAPHAWKKVPLWAGRRDEFVKRAAFALLASLALHDREAADAQFLHGLELIERESGDDRNFVKKGVSWALRSIGRRRSPGLRTAALATAKRLAESQEPAARWVGKDALRDFAKAQAKRDSA
ncbi:DNA alkylation repair protein [Lysobacter niastensis]|uniref:DNA alkylation repair protein n=2 Tax=Lysobacter niastensis TaxID=380629 RepID=A0ABS0BBV8_9GAMM|nr:DNA alkylation repair protein [Lysobacter niastensis]